MKCYIIGASGFIGQNITDALKKAAYSVQALSRQDFDLQKEEDYKQFDFENSIIIDCIASIEGDKIMEINYDSLKNFIEYLNEHSPNYKYVYFSTTSAGVSNTDNMGEYIKSKVLAEKYILKHVLNYLILRLSFPFGVGQSPARLLPRLIHYILDDQKIVVNNVKLNLTPIGYIKSEFVSILNIQNKIINFINDEVFMLKDIIEYIYAYVGKSENTTLSSDPIVDLTVEKNFASTCEVDVLLNMERLIDDIR